MSNETSAINAFIATLTGGGLIAAVNEYATFLGICIAATGLLMGFFFHVLTVLYRRRVEKRGLLEYREEIKKEIVAELEAEKNEQTI